MMLRSLRLGATLALLFAGHATSQTPESPILATSLPVSEQALLRPKITEDKLLDAIHAKQAQVAASCSAPGDHIDGLSCVLPPPPPPPVVVAPVRPEVPISNYEGDDLVGSLGWSTPTGNCVDEPGVNNPGWGNPIDWPITSTTPWIGASALFVFNHVAVVTGIWSNGDIEVAQENSPGAPHRISPSLIRGYR